MRKSTDICLLCNERQSTQRNSHLIPKHLGQGIFYGTTPRHGILIDKSTGKERKIQDIIKEDYILCQNCEKGISIFESYCALRLERFNNLSCYNEFRKYKKGKFEFFECLRIDIRLFNLFIYSIVWRLSVTENDSFLKFKLPNEEEEKIRLLINDYISPTQNDLMNRLDKLDILPDNHSHVFIRPSIKLRPPKAMLSAASLNEWTHVIHMVDYILFYFTDRSKLVDVFTEIDNNTVDRFVRIGLLDPVNWENYNFDLIKKWRN